MAVGEMVIHEVLPEDVWSQRTSAHEARVAGWVEPMLARAERGERHPVEDFLFTYYSYRPSQLRRWSPGAGVALTGPGVSAFVGRTSWTAVEAGVALVAPPPRVSRTAAWICELLDSTAGRPAQFGCFGLHEWAMVHRQHPHEVRHGRWPLRLGAEGTDDVVESLPIRCTHFDAFRFFSESARPLNATVLTRAGQHDVEQGGCLHANMDLYKWAYKLAPWVPAELVADCFDLARRVRALDMRASPYDLTGLGYEPVQIETTEGRRQYAEAQRDFAAEAAPLRSRLATVARQLR